MNQNVFILSLLSLPLLSLSSCECNTNPNNNHNSQTLPLKLAAIAAILMAAAVGVAAPIIGKRIPTLNPDGNPFVIVKAFAAGVILATAMIHILPNAFEMLTSPCLSEGVFGRFPFAGFVAMVSAVMTMMVDGLAMGFYRRGRISKALPVDDDVDDVAVVESGNVHVHRHGGFGEEGEEAETIRRRVISQVLELGIVVHSVIIGISLGTSTSSSTVRPLLGALSFHQFFEGIGLGGCIVQAKFRVRAQVIMSLFFSLTTPIGIALGIAISSGYNSNSRTALAVEGIFTASSAGILMYMALVDLLAADFMSPRLQNNLRLQLGAYLGLLLGLGLMSTLAIWA